MTSAPSDPPVDVSDRFTLLVGAPESEPVACTLEEITAEGARIELPATLAPAIGVSRPAELWISDEESGTSVVVPAVNTQRKDSEGKVEFYLQFTDPGAVKALLHRDLLRLFDRRQAFRAVPTEGQIVEVTVEPPPEAEVPPVRTTLVDISTTGLAFDVPVGFEAEMILFDYVTLHFLLPGCTWPNVVVAEIRNRSWNNPTRVRYGVEFNSERTIRWDLQAEQIMSYVVERQRAMTGEEPMDRSGYTIRTMPPPVQNRG